MFGWFNAPKVDHPLAEAKESRRIVEDLPKDAYKALGEIGFWLESVNATAEFRLDRRFELIEQLDLAARAHVRKISQEYLQIRQQRFQEHRAWAVLTDFWRHLGAGYAICIEGFQADSPGAGAIKQRLALVLARALHALGQQLKWLLLRYGPIEAALWGRIGRLYAFAETKAMADTATVLYEGTHATTPQRECLHVLMLASASTESLLPEQIETVERSAAHFARHFVMAASPRPDATHCFDLAMLQPPRRKPRNAGGDASMRYFGAAGAFGEMRRLLEVLLAEGALPHDVVLGAAQEPKAIETVWRHLLQYWAAEGPERRSERQPANVRLAVVPGFGEILRALQGLSDTLDFSTEGESGESWVAENASDGGYGARVPATRGDWLQVGALIGLRAEGQTRWGVGVVRRLLREEEPHRRVGIEVLAQVAVAVRLAPCGVISSFNATRENDPAVLLTPKPDAERQVRLLLRAGAYTPEQALEMRVHGQAFELQTVRLIEASEQCDVGLFTLLRRID